MLLDPAVRAPSARALGADSSTKAIVAAHDVFDPASNRLRISLLRRLY
ncbi:MAG: hypothetical protein R3E46_10080 [Sedimenticolaceae bacterium]